MTQASPYLATLSVNPLFADLGAPTLKKIAALCVRRSIDNDQTLFLKGDAGDALYGVRRGRIEISTSTEDGRKLILNVLGSGDIFGEIALLDGRPRTADAVAGETSELFMIRRADFQKLLCDEPQIALQIIALLCSRLRWVSERVEESALLPVSARLGRRLLKLAEDFGDDIRISQEDLGVLSGATRETVNRILQQWRRERVIALSRGRLQVLDRKRLQAKAMEPTG